MEQASNAASSMSKGVETAEEYYTQVNTNKLSHLLPRTANLTSFVFLAFEFSLARLHSRASRRASAKTVSYERRMSDSRLTPRALDSSHISYHQD